MDVLGLVKSIYPTHVGMNRMTEANEAANANLPHACGDEPRLRLYNKYAARFTPRMWG